MNPDLCDTCIHHCTEVGAVADHCIEVRVALDLSGVLGELLVKGIGDVVGGVSGDQ